MTEILALMDSQRARWDELERRRFVFLVALVALNASDLLLTRVALGMGAGSEQNALMALVIGGWLGVVVKLGYPAWLGWRNLRRPLDTGLVRGLAVVVWLYLFVVTWNSYAIVRHLA